MKFFLRYWVPVIVWMLLIFSASGDAKSGQHTDGILSQLLRWLHVQVTATQLETMRWTVRKAAHLTEYAVLALLCWRALRAHQHAKQCPGRTAGIALLICIVYAASDEFHQAFVKDRSASMLDVCIDTAGAAFALLTVRVVTARKTSERA
ncbi:MAG TPA: VanZ family protein [Candidatus Acidoferrum sp.]|nr:VanZ family protein [Candidatus Acidoferrum sp.]